MSNVFVIIKTCYVHNQWYDISCATLYITLLRHQAYERLNPTYSFKLPVIYNIMYNDSLFLKFWNITQTTDQAIPNTCTKLQNTKFKCCKYMMLCIIVWVKELEVWEPQLKFWTSTQHGSVYWSWTFCSFLCYKNSEILCPMQYWFSFN